MRSSLVPNTGHSLASSPLQPLGWAADSFFDRLFGERWNVGSGNNAFGMPLEIHETENDITVLFEVPGVAAKDVEIDLTGRVLTLAVEKRDERETSDPGRTYSERRFGSVRRSLQLPCTVEADQVKAEHENGVVTVTMQKSAGARSRRIEIESR